MIKPPPDLSDNERLQMYLWERDRGVVHDMTYVLRMSTIQARLKAEENVRQRRKAFKVLKGGGTGGTDV